MTRNKRPPSAEERELFESALHDATPLGSAPPRPGKSGNAAPTTPSHPITPHAKPAAGHQMAGIDGNTAGRLRRGLLEPQARLDLHGLTEQAAHRALVTFLRGAKARKLRLVLVVTGKGQPRTPEAGTDRVYPGPDRGTRGVLRTATPRWLREPGLAELIADAREAHRRHGGAGALYIYLRKG